MRGGWRGKLPRSSLSSFLVGRDGGATAWPTSNGSHAMTSDSWFPRPFARALNTKDPLAREGLAVVPKDIAGARFVSQGDARIVEQAATRFEPRTHGILECQDYCSTSILFQRNAISANGTMWGP